VAQRPLAEAVPARPALDAAPVPPPAIVSLSGRQVRLVQFALDGLLESVAREEPIASEVRALVDELERAPAPVAGGAVADLRAAWQDMLEGIPVQANPGLIQSGYPVFASPTDGALGRIGQFVGVVEDVRIHRGGYCVHVRGGLEGANELRLPIAAVRAVHGHQVHLNLSVEDLLGQPWHIDPALPGD
jgi:hypothetical protein